jgi:hypothetical protein
LLVPGIIPRATRTKGDSDRLELNAGLRAALSIFTRDAAEALVEGRMDGSQ